MFFSQWWRNGYRGEQKPAIPTPPWSLRSELAHPKQWGEEECSASRAGVPMLQELMPDDLRGSWCSNNRNKVHNKCNALESSPNHPHPLGPWKNSLPRNLSLVPKRLGTSALENRKMSVQKGHGFRGKWGTRKNDVNYHNDIIEFQSVGGHNIEGNWC